MLARIAGETDEAYAARERALRIDDAVELALEDGPGRIGETIAQLTDLLVGDPALLDEETGLLPDEVRDVLARLARRVD